MITNINKLAVCFFLSLVVAIGFPLQSPAQQSEKKVTLNMAQKPMATILTEIKKQTGMDYGFKSGKRENTNETFTLNVKQASVEAALNAMFKDSDWTYQIVENLILISRKSNTSASSGNELARITGRITDPDGNPIPGATVIVANTNRGAVSDGKGMYELMAYPDDLIQVSFIGYKTEVVQVRGRSKVDVSIEMLAENVEEVTVVAFGTQKKESVVSAITTVRPMDLKTSSSDLTTSLAGRVAGIIGWQTGGLPAALTDGEMNTKFYIRGVTSFQQDANVNPLILIDGVESSRLDLSRIAPEDMESFSVLKDASATAMYGARGANGVILVTTKKGKEGSVYTTARYEYIMSAPTKEIEVVDPITYMRMYNQALLTRNPQVTPKYSVEDINRRLSGKYPNWLYPMNDWYDMMLKDVTTNQHMGVNVRGGSKVLQYYASLNYNQDMGNLKTDRLNQFNINLKNNQTTFRTNLTINLKSGIQLLLNSSTSYDKYHGPLVSPSGVYGMAFSASPVDFAALYPADDTYNWPHLRFGSTDGMQTNPYMQLHQGYSERIRYSATNKAEYIQNLTQWIKGLEFRASIAFSQSGYNSTIFKTTPFLYTLADYDDETGTHTLRALNASEAKRTLDLGPKQSTSQTQVVYEGRLMHTAAWDKHATSLMGIFQMMESNSNPVNSVMDGMPHRNMTFSMRGTYGFNDKYFAEASFGYNGSERFAANNRWGFFPAGGVAWVISKENFMQSTSNFLPLLKLRASYGKVGNDGIIKEPRFVYLPRIIKDGTYRDPEPFTTDITQYHIYNYPNTGIQWEIAETVNFGLEVQMLRGIFEFTLDAFQETRHNILGTRNIIPSPTGIEYAPLDNIGKARSRGIDFAGKYQHAFSNDFWIILNGTVTYSKAIYQEIEEAIDKPWYQRMKGQELSQAIGYIAEGLFRDQAEIDNSPTQSGNVMPGDIRYRDLNGDGVIDVEDVTYIGYPTTPRLIYGFYGMVNYKNVEFNFAFQGSGQRSFFINASSISPFTQDRAMLKSIYESHWSEDNMTDTPFWPRLSTYNITEHNPEEGGGGGTEMRRSTYFMRSCSFLRCTSLELAYNMPKKLMTKWKLQGVKFYTRVNNPFLITNFKEWDVELGESAFAYPIQRTFSFGVNLSF